jgi:hypothetical protein
MKHRQDRPSPRDVTNAEIDAAIGETLAATPLPDAMHVLFDQHIRTVLDDAGLSEEDKQAVLVAMSCPCCGGGGASLSYKIKPKS